MFFHYSSFTCLLLVTISNLGLAKERLSTSCPNGVCYRNEDEGPCELKDDEPRLFRWDPVKVRCTLMFVAQLFDDVCSRLVGRVQDCDSRDL